MKVAYAQTTSGAEDYDGENVVSCNVFGPRGGTAASFVLSPTEARTLRDEIDRALEELEPAAPICPDLAPAPLSEGEAAQLAAMPAKREKPVCATCGSDDVAFDAWAVWDADAQGYDLGSVFDEAHCHACEDQRSIEWAAVEDQPAPAEVEA